MTRLETRLPLSRAYDVDLEVVKVVIVLVLEEVVTTCEVEKDTDMITNLANYKSPEMDWAVSVDLGFWS